MGGLPTNSQLEKRGKNAQEKIRRFKKLHDDFLSMWKKATEEEKGLLKDYSQMINKTQVASVLKTIEKL